MLNILRMRNSGGIHHFRWQDVKHGKGTEAGACAWTAAALGGATGNGNLLYTIRMTRERK
jgi:hypothetical protein